MKKNFLPIAINIAGEKILIIGGGQSAWKKIHILKRFGADVEVVALEVCDEIRNSGILYRQKSYEKQDLKGYLMFYSCTNNPDLDRQIAQDGREAGVLVNIHDQPELCQFVSPAIYQQGNIRVAVSSNAEDVFESIRLRNEIKDYLENKNKKQ
ncbi:precorrin-2 dehydrogenase/sirohydrochlorin ferrochelatase family protein [Gaoshiqia sediminis]|uniref:precorrin-2 dehydrogenase n=1 Tax=Gaoshiqia sediminis TaxID=2986998 RepID=A0AA41YC33_9BACT|nr:bifunctional precorrin-2 dehydrogenase/sirohydrochlorin ferrochelatase [Gaoshiqia sediminis]MCW0483578.1 bifunctional precorrin-2 dehydrogenase/sirohydrochlorin ferrochelatase [Gaoshiqia sediminis]